MINAPHIEHARLWLEAHDPRLTPRRPRAALASADPGDSGFSPPVASGTVLVGSQVQQAKQADSAVKAAFPAPGTTLTPDAYNALLTTFTNSPATGCTTVMDMARIAAGFNPLSPDLAGNQAAFDDYVKRIMAAPFFHLDLSDRSDYHRHEQNWSTAIDAILGLFQGIAAEDKDKIANSIGSLAKAVASRSNTRNTQTLFAQSVLNLDQEIKVFIYSSTVAMEESQSKGSDSKQTDISIARAQLTFYKNLWPGYAQMVMGKHVKLISDWLTDNTTPPGPLPTKLNVKGGQ